MLFHGRAAWLLFLLVPGSAGASPLYQVTPVGALPGTSGAKGLSINNLGQIAGYAGYTGTTITAFVYTPGVSLMDLGAVTGLPDTQAWGINNLGQIVATYTYQGNPNNPFDLQTRTFIYTPGTGATILGTLGGTEVSGFAINDLGQVVGAADLPGTPNLNHAFVYTPGLSLSLLNLPGQSSGATAINNHGQIAGGDGSAFLYTPGQSPPSLDVFQGSANGINDLGQVVGDGLIYTPGVGPATIGGVNSYQYDAFDINNQGQAVGLFSLGGNGTVDHAFYYSGGVTTDLNDLIDPSLGITLYEARGINDSGQIVANSTVGEVYLLTPVPEPASVGIVAIGFLTIAVIRNETGTERFRFRRTVAKRKGRSWYA